MESLMYFFIISLYLFIYRQFYNTVCYNFCILIFHSYEHSSHETDFFSFYSLIHEPVLLFLAPKWSIYL